MIDTIILKVNRVPARIDPDVWFTDTKEHPGGRIYTKHYYNQKYKAVHGGDFTVAYTYYPIDRSGKPLLLIQFSLPMAVYGNNYTLVYDIKDAASRVNEILETDPNIPHINLIHGYLYRIDFCCHHAVGDQLDCYLRTLKTLDYPRRKTLPYLDKGVVYSSKLTQTSFYDKYSECKEESARGILRQETKIRGSRPLESAFGKKKPRLEDVTIEIATKVLEDDLKRLAINERAFVGPEKVLRELKRAYPKNTMKYFGVLCAVSMLKKELAVSYGVYKDKHQLNRVLKDMKDKGIPILDLKGKKKMPPLKINLQEESKNDLSQSH